MYNFELENINDVMNYAGLFCFYAIFIRCDMAPETSHKFLLELLFFFFFFVFFFFSTYEYLLFQKKNE